MDTTSSTHDSSPVSYQEVAEQRRFNAAREQGIPWKKWAPYLSERQWGTVREDYSSDGNTWNHSSQDQARSRAYHWGEHGIAGISDDKQQLCFNWFIRALLSMYPFYGDDFKVECPTGSGEYMTLYEVDYGLLAQCYVEGFHEKWIAGHRTPDEELLGSADIQSLADLGNSYGLVRDMRVVPFGLDDISRLAAVTVAPFPPLLLTIWSPEELIMRLIRWCFDDLPAGNRTKIPSAAPPLNGSLRAGYGTERANLML